MSTDYTGREPETSATDAEGVLFAATPAWERGRKRRGFGARKTARPTAQVSEEPRSFEAPRSFAATNEPEITRERMATTAATLTPSTLAAEEPAFAVAPPRATATRRASPAKGGVSPIAIAGGVAAVAILASVGWVATRPQDGVTALTPGEPTTTSEVAAAPLSPAPAPAAVERPMQTAQLEAPASGLRAAPRTVSPTQARVRPAARAVAAPSAGENAANVSASLPDSPKPYATMNPAATPAPITPAAPTQVTPAAPAPTETAPTQVTPPASTTTPETTQAPPPVESPPTS